MAESESLENFVEAAYDEQSSEALERDRVQNPGAPELPRRPDNRLDRAARQEPVDVLAKPERDAAGRFTSRNQEPGPRSQEAGARNQEPGARKQARSPDSAVPGVADAAGNPLISAGNLSEVIGELMPHLGDVARVANGSLGEFVRLHLDVVRQMNADPWSVVDHLTQYATGRGIPRSGDPGTRNQEPGSQDPPSYPHLTAEVDEAIKAFAADAEAHPHFARVKPLMGQLLQGGAATTLKQAYQQACKIDPEISALERAEADKARLDEAGKRAAAARRAASINVEASEPARPTRQKDMNSTIADVVHSMMGTGR